MKKKDFEFPTIFMNIVSDYRRLQSLAIKFRLFTMITLQLESIDIHHLFITYITIDILSKSLSYKALTRNFLCKISLSQKIFLISKYYNISKYINIVWQRNDKIKILSYNTKNYLIKSMIN